ncbi:signal peptidase I [Hydromonas duriensis]|uniref:Signal peptidase I n=1 Tax=Hydromonas duriensis TaxID=1527608 RepID=A0A4R6Y8G5_9BURK|nr:signal peptidase I [Hydromonas duriensis]TDR31694.1 signal peptidase I [Hydromonas duriensis]
MWFSILLVMLFLVTGFFWVLDMAVFKPKRVKKAQAIKAQMQGGYDDAVQEALARPVWLEYTAGLFGVVALVFVLRSFVTEPFRIPSSSMVPTLLEGDFLLVNKFAYGLRMPITNQVVVPVGHPNRGDVVVFHYPLDPKTDFIKRVVGLPGDTVVYENKQLTINGKVIEQKSTNISNLKPGTYAKDIPLNTVYQSDEMLADNGQSHAIWTEERHPTYIPQGVRLEAKQACKYNETGFTCTVPKGHYFMMGDNRDYSDDSRYWGFVPDENLVGRAYFVWMNFNDFSRIGTSVK